jgi:hypothetical protein
MNFIKFLLFASSLNTVNKMWKHHISLDTFCYIIRCNRKAFKLTGVPCTVPRLRNHRYCPRGFAKNFAILNTLMASSSRFYKDSYIKELDFIRAFSPLTSTASSFEPDSVLRFSVCRSKYQQRPSGLSDLSHPT